MDQYLIYLRKSRSDIGTEDIADVLARHEDVLVQFASRQRLSIGAIYREVVSGESIDARPFMKRLLREVRSGLWAGVLVIEVERLARGDTQDQGIIQQAFYYSNTKIITPVKTYDPMNEFDMEFFEFGLFMSRREYKAITRRMKMGRISSQMEGKYVGSKTPYGYEKVKLKGEKGFTLRPVPEQAETVKLIFDMYLDRGLGPIYIARELNALGIPNYHGKPWTHYSVTAVLKNQVYTGVIVSGRRNCVKRMNADGEIIVGRPIADNIKVYPGLHEAIVSPETYQKVVEKMQSRCVPTITTNNSVKNPFRGLVSCGVCGLKMQRKLFKGVPQLICVNPECDNSSIRFSIFEARVVETLEAMLNDLNVSLRKTPKKDSSRVVMLEKAIKDFDAEHAELEKQRSSLHDLLERGVYDADTFVARSKNITERIDAILSQKKNALNELSIENKPALTPRKAIRILELFKRSTDMREANELIRKFVESIVFTREAGGRWCDQDNFTLDIHLKL